MPREEATLDVDDHGVSTFELAFDACHWGLESLRDSRCAIGGRCVACRKTRRSGITLT